MSRTVRAPKPRNLASLEMTRNPLFRTRKFKSRDALLSHRDAFARKGKHKARIGVENAYG